MMRILSLIVLLSLAAATSATQSDSIAAPREFRFRPAIRGAYLEATSLFFMGASGVSLDIDFLQLSSATLLHAGIHLTYQEIESGPVLSGRSDFRPAYLRGAFLRGTSRRLKVRTDIMLGVGSYQEQYRKSQVGVLAVVDIHWMIVEPYCSFFLRVFANQRGAAPLFGVAIGYLD